ncbi:glucosaminidase domain-containing protein [Sporosarcina jeotgali]|uniref:Glucosaminidase domain-containing protein n=1 Tax=Sporosarcina jeotgali TaxID=3020056 RepID=A0ABZ0KWJ1_9BACL|nr:glucosaminidase domain-containing protein [Sporosarcina sp. B2O-1]WOV84756.1 glucosaminidase domain-containing protein [Sporosarcina sp. B2O-1]
MANSKLLPSQTVTNQSYYYVKNGSIYHNLYSHSGKKFEVYEAGKAPGFMEEGKKYYSTDSANFTSESGKFVGTAHQYFQYLPLLSKTSYTAEEIDVYIMKKLQQLEKDYPNNPDYKNASQRSKLIGIGTLLKQMESTYHVNALHVLGISQNESTYGLSDHAQKNNNLFGLYVSDTNPANKQFSSIEANVKELMTAFLTKNYLPPKGAYANGTNLGNKAVGVNVKYASDPYWGSKIAGHMYRIDREMGGHELANPKDIRIANTKSLKFRLDPSTNQDYAYHYKNIGMPLTVIDDQIAEAPWMIVQSDIAPHGVLYTHGDFVDKLQLP